MHNYIFPGVMFKGQCKNVGTIWTEGCFTYQVRLIGNTPMYRLKEGGMFDRVKTIIHKNKINLQYDLLF